MSLRIYPKNDNEAAFLKALLDRMQIVYEENSLDTDALYQGLNLDELPRTIPYEDLSDEPLVISSPNAQALDEALEQHGAAWAQDESETLDELLNMLTP